MKDAVQTDWLEKARERTAVTSAEMATYVEMLNRVNPAMGESKQVFSAVETALVLFGTEDTTSLYALVDSGAIGHTDIGTRERRRCVFTRGAILEFLRSRCSDGVGRRRA